MARRKSKDSLKSTIRQNDLFKLNLKRITKGNTLYANVRLKTIRKGFREYLVSLRDLQALVTTNKSKLLEFMGETMRDLIATRVVPEQVPVLEVLSHEKPLSNQALADAATKIVAVIKSSKPIVIGDNKVGIIGREDLDKVKLVTGGRGRKYEGNLRSTKTRSQAEADVLGTTGGSIIGIGRSERATASPYNIAWMILEFGTGRYAIPRKRLADDGRLTKVPGGGGSWKWGPISKRYGHRVGPEVIGQKPDSFLFETRENQERFRQDKQVLLEKISEEIIKIFKRK